MYYTQNCYTRRVLGVKCFCYVSCYAERPSGSGLNFSMNAQVRNWSMWNMLNYLKYLYMMVFSFGAALLEYDTAEALFSP